MRAVLLVAALVALTRPALAEERVLYCAETASAGFIWDEGKTEGRLTGFTASRYVVKVLSETKRTVTKTTGDTAGHTVTYTCRKAYPSTDPEFIVCDDGTGTSPWLFNGNKFVLAFLEGTPVGRDDPNIFVNYGTCTGF